MGIYLNTAKTLDLYRIRAAVHGFADMVSGTLFRSEADHFRDCQLYRGLEVVWEMCSTIFWMTHFKDDSTYYVTKIMQGWSHVRMMFPGEYDENSPEFNILKMARVLMEAVSDAVIWDECEKA